MIKELGFSKWRSAIVGSPIYVFPKINKPEDAEFIEYKKEGTRFGYFKKYPIYTQIEIGVYIHNIIGYTIPIKGLGYAIYTDNLFEKLSDKAKNYVLLHEEVHGISGKMIERGDQTHVEFECEIDRMTGLTKEEIISSIEDIIKLLKDESRIFYRMQIKFFKQKIKYHKSH